MGRISWDQYFMKLAEDVATRSTCMRHKVGAVIVNEKHDIISTGYNGNPRGMKHCDDIGCIRDIQNIPSGERAEVCTAVHAEQNAMIQAGRGSRGATLYCNIQPCNTCAKMIANAGIVRVVYRATYPDSMGIEMLKDLGIEVKLIGGK